MLKISLLTLFSLLFSQTFALKIVRTTCEFQESPIALHTITPRFGWEMSSDKNNSMQTAYEIEVSGQDKHDLFWASGRINSAESQLVRYNGKALKQGQSYRWRVRVWDEQGKRSGWSKYANFRMAPSTEMMRAKWIGAIPHRRCTDTSREAIPFFRNANLRNKSYLVCSGYPVAQEHYFTQIVSTKRQKNIRSCDPYQRFGSLRI